MRQKNDDGLSEVINLAINLLLQPKTYHFSFDGNEARIVYVLRPR